MQFRQLRYYVKIVDAGSFSRAAALIHIAQPALSQQIAELEARLGVSLLQRSARGVRPTAAGEILYREAFAILKQLDQLPGIVRSSNGVAQGTVSFREKLSSQSLDLALVFEDDLDSVFARQPLSSSRRST
jgi:LysR family nitrogen assimilation transcriptional regulator